MVAPSLSLIFDDTALGATYGGGSWTTSTLPSWYNGSCLYPAFAIGGNGTGTASFSFQGTSVAFFGNTAPVFTDSQILTVAIDGGKPYNTTYDDPSPQSYRQWYRSPTLAEGKHNISLSHIAGTALDFAVVTVGRNTPLARTKVIVDNEDPSITYTGSWTQNTDKFVPGSLPSGLPYHNSTHQSVNAGDSFAFSFTGSSVSIYGIMSWANLGSIETTYTLDGSPLSRTYTVTQSTPQFAGNSSDQNNYLLFSLDSILSGNHMLVVNVISVTGGQTFIFDYLTYTPYFWSLASMPNLTGVSSTSGAHSSSTSTPSPSVTSSSKSSPAGAIAGGMIGGLILLSAIAAFFYWFGKRSASQNTAQNTALPTNYASEPLSTNMRQQTPSNENTISPFLDAGVTQYGLASYVPTAVERKQGLHSEQFSSTTSGDPAMSDATTSDDLGSLARGRSEDPAVGNVFVQPPSYDNIPGNSRAEYQQPLVPQRKS
ncbi:hypothetical protein K443DRAFT_417841 [Laccaria amethystina LaAM-08-1]|uniref:Transmembrane protein n=1 Tax=Laccaria amethystina LaAM-08-1 TaxID=1095629 RepID=A0A0C9XS91_9AGAR|nr:hypothetical protein K443DRAFT_417841 [Laccaria amethystina LaAM-08-1]